MSVSRSCKKPRIESTSRSVPRPLRQGQSSSPSVAKDVIPSPTVGATSEAVLTTDALDAAFLVAAIENRANEVGIAVLDATRQKLLLMQFIETSRTYTTTQMLFHRFPPRPLILVDEKTKSRAGELNLLSRDVDDQIAIPRGCFDDANGELLIERLATEKSDLESHMQNKRRHYLAIGAAGALLTYLRDYEKRSMAHQTLDIEFMGTEKHMQLDLMSMECLGIAKPGRVMDKMSSPSLFEVMNRAKTACGAKLLKANLLQPLTHIPTLQCRYEAVQEIVEREGLRKDCVEALETIPKDLDRICSIFTLHTLESPAEGVKSGKENVIARKISTLIDGVILMKEVLESLHSVREALQDARSALLRGIYETVGNALFKQILESVCSVLDDQVHRQRTAALKRIEQCYAIKSGFDGFLDVARTNFCKITEQIHALANRLQEEYHLENIKACSISAQTIPKE